MPAFIFSRLKRYCLLALFSFTSNVYAHCDGFCMGSTDTPWEDLPPRERRAFLDGLGDTKISVDYQKLDGRRSQWDTKFSGVRNILFDRFSETTNENTKARLE